MPPEPEPEIVELGVREHVTLLLRRKWVILLVTLTIVGLAALWSVLAEPAYQARARVLVQPRETTSLFQPARGPAPDPNRLVQTEILVFDSPQLRAEVRRRIGVAPRVSALQLAQTDVIEVIASSDDPQRAAEVANAYATAYIDLRRQQAVAEVVSVAEQLQNKISELQREIDAASGQQRSVLIDQQAVFRQKLDQLQVDAALQQRTARLISDAPVPRSPSSPDPVRTGILSLVFGLITGIGVALALGFLDETVRSPEHVERVLPATRVIGVIPAVSGWKRGDEAVVASLDAPLSPTAEAFRTLRTALQFLFLDSGIRVLQVTSPNPGDGKSSTAANLAVAMARAGTRVVVVDADLRRSRLGDFFGLDGSVGLTSVLSGEATLAEATVAVAGVTGLSVLPAGPPPPDPSELLSTRRMADLVASLRAEGTMVLVDSPPVLPVTDALVLSGRADATVLVCAAGRTRRKDLRRAADLLAQVGERLVGVVLNGVDPEYAYRTPTASRHRHRHRRLRPAAV